MGLFHKLEQRWTNPTDRGQSAWGRIALAGDGDIYDLPLGGISYARLDRGARRAAGLLHSFGLRPGDVIALQLPRSLAFLELHLGALALGAVSLTLNDHYTPPELRYFLDDAEARLTVLMDPDAARDTGGELLAVDDVRAALDAATPLDDLPEPDDNALACLMYTSGTTGRPKGAMLSHRNLLATIQALHQAWQWGPKDHLLHALPLFHIHGLFVAQYGALWAGARTTWMSHFDAAGALSTLARERCTVFMGVPTFYHRMLCLIPATDDCPDPDLSHMRLFTSGSAALPAADHADFAARYCHTIVERYGMTEVGIVLSNPVDGGQRAGTVGMPLPGVDARIVDPQSGSVCPPGQIGEIRIRGASVTSGYLGQPEQTAQALGDGWMKTGDLGTVDADGYFRIVGRIKDLVISGGFNVHPLEVEAVLCQAPGVAEAAVIGLPD
ncbi:MAG: AMP-binding protein, partial [Oligoflexia bacterium]|nr:AMP-binding protein [Oligoflexia bacterium]